MHKRLGHLLLFILMSSIFTAYIPFSPDSIFGAEEKISENLIIAEEESLPDYISDDRTASVNNTPEDNIEENKPETATEDIKKDEIYSDYNEASENIKKLPQPYKNDTDIETESSNDTASSKHMIPDNSISEDSVSENQVSGASLSDYVLLAQSYTDFNLEDYTYSKNDTAKTITLQKYKGSDADIYVPKQISTGGENYSIKLANVYSDSNAIWKQVGEKTIKKIFFEDRSVLPSNSYDYLFSGCSSLTETNINEIGSSGIKYMNYMFHGCSSIHSLDLSNFDTSSLTQTMNMFEDCTSLESVNLSSFKDAKLSTMYRMFYNCSSLKELDLHNLDTSDVVTFEVTFRDCSSLEHIYGIDSFDTSASKSMHMMFNGCTKLKELDVSNFNTSNVTDMAEMFAECENLEVIDVSSFDTSKVTKLDDMFCDCKKVKKLNISNFNTANVTNMENMFTDCELIEELDFSNFNTSKVTDMDEMFHGCKSLKKLDLSSFDTSNVTDINDLCNFCSSLTELDISSFDLSKIDLSMYTDDYPILILDNKLERLNIPKKLNFKIPLPYSDYVREGTEAPTFAFIPYNDGSESYWIVRKHTEPEPPGPTPPIPPEPDPEPVSYKIYVKDLRTDSHYNTAATAAITVSPNDADWYLVIKDSDGTEINPWIQLEKNLRNYKKKRIYDITLHSGNIDGPVVQDFGSCSLHLSLPEEMDLKKGSLKLVSMKDGKLDKTLSYSTGISKNADNTVEMQYIDFLTPHFTDFALLYYVKQPTPDKKDKKEPEEESEVVNSRSNVYYAQSAPTAPVAIPVRQLDNIPKTGDKRYRK